MVTTVMGSSRCKISDLTETVTMNLKVFLKHSTPSPKMWPVKSSQSSQSRKGTLKRQTAILNFDFWIKSDTHTQHYGIVPFCSLLGPDTLTSINQY